MSLLALALLAFQTHASVAGTVLESGRREPIRYALVEVIGTRQRTLTDEDGLFVLGQLPEGDHALRVTAPGYRTTEHDLLIASDQPVYVLITLEPDPIPIGEAIVIAGRLHGFTQIDAPGARMVDTLLLDLIPAVVERDLLRAVQVEPSVTPSSDMSTAMFVRGGTPDQTRVFLDGTPVHNVFHLGSFVSAFTPSATAAAVLQAGALPASVPSSLSGSLDVHTRDGSRDSLRFEGGVGLLTSALTIDGPLPSGGGAYLISGRRTYVDVAVGAAHRLRLTDSDLPYGFYDVMTKVTKDLGPHSSLTVSGYFNREGYEAEPDSVGDEDVEVLNADWGANAASLRLRTLRAGRFQIEAGIGTSGFVADWSEEHRESEVPGLESSMRTWVADAQGKASVGSHVLMGGIQWERTNVDHLFDTQAFDRVLDLDVRGSFGSAAAFARDRWRATNDLTLDAGLRLEWPLHRRPEVLPRGRIEWTGTSQLSLALGAGRYVQDWWSPRNEEGVGAAYVGYDLPLPVAGARELPSGWDIVAEARAQIGSWAVRSDAFVKRLNHIVISPVSLDPVRADYTLDLDSLRTGLAQVHGVELSVSGSTLGFALFASYRWQNEQRRLSGDTWVPRSDRRHRLILAGSRGWGEREISASLTWMSGPPYTPVTGREPALRGYDPSGRPTGGSPRLVFGPANSARLPAYLRLDLSGRGSWDVSLFGRRGELEPYISVLNILGRTNSLFAEPQGRFDGGQVVVKRGPQIPVLPSIGLRWRF
jgi:hypothetical protein